ncbi:SusC/RagA family TonB-linked outer membrane protein [Sinomicrobium soli]|uniref:SusC/RagA family TonB-linked outer membrane protein n=1 Tax=Sinomicrobium sp. N-1-3-6 TaxID=2219864 RepID=UPI000DCD0532|nr:TonB-dependent receptor [Sinomicrobium sp. N-1-3-6]RAV29546.1 SusC/RagA family protein [Sinomicrobium sp. N-1-3-6]
MKRQNTDQNYKGRNRIFIWQYAVVLAVLLSVQGILAQNTFTASGTVTDNEGNLLPGATVMIKGTSNGTSTDFDGRFELNVTPTATLVVSYIGFLSQEVVVTEDRDLEITLQTDAQALDEVVVVGYGTQSKATVTSAISTVKGEKLADVPTNTVSSKLQGRLPGVSVKTIGGQPGQELQIRIRGGSSINKSNAPLVLVDGFQRTLNDLNAEDIESIDVLKDASATSIYGSRASNGVILVTTKRGKDGKSRLDLNVTTGIQSFNRQYDLLSAREYLEWWRPRIATSRYGNTEGWLDGAQPTGIGNDEASTWTPRLLQSGEAVPDGWQSMVDPLTGETITFQDADLPGHLYRDALQSNYNLSATGGNENIKYAAGLGYTDQEGIAIGTKYQRLNGRVNLDFKVNERIKIGTKTDFSYSKTNSFPNEAAIFTRGVHNAPTLRSRFPDGSPGWGTNATLANPQFIVETRDAKTQRTFGTFGVNASWEPIDDFVIKGSTFLQVRLNAYDYFEKAHQFNQLRNATADRNTYTTTQSELLLTYKKILAEKHNFDFLLGFTDLYMKTDNAALAANGGATDNIPTLNAAPTKQDASTSLTKERLVSQFFRLNYNYDLKYLFSASLRRDGSSKFGKGNRFGYFPSVSLGWIISKENFFSQGKLLDFLKVRASYGVTGNNDIGRFVAQGVYQAAYRYGGNAGTSATAMPNSALTWEKTTQTDLGIEIGLLDQSRIQVSADIYKRRTDDLLFTVQLPRESGFNSVEQNIGTVEYQGIEFGITSTNIATENFSWTSNLNFAYNTNKVKKLPYREGIDKNRINGIILPDGSGVGGIAEGESLGAITGYKVDYLIDTPEQAANARYDQSANGYDPQTGQLVGRGTKFAGDFEWVDRDGDGSITNLDQFVIGNSIPTTTGGITNTLSYKNFTLDIFMDYALGHTVVDMVHAWMDGNKTRRVATTTSVLNAWQQPGDAAHTNQPRSDFHDQNHQDNLRKSDFYAVKGDYLSLRNISLTYKVPADVLKNKLSRLELYVTGNNLYYFTKYKGPNPERGGTIGHQDGQYPPFRTFTIGARIGL